MAPFSATVTGETIEEVAEKLLVFAAALQTTGKAPADADESEDEENDEDEKPAKGKRGRPSKKAKADEEEDESEDESEDEETEDADESEDEENDDEDSDEAEGNLAGVKDAFRKLMSTKGEKKMDEVLKKFKAKKISDIDPSKHEAAIAAAKKATK